MKTSQIHDGFATIRSRGVQRNRFRLSSEHLERLRPLKCDSMPLYEDPTHLSSLNGLNYNNNNHKSENKNFTNDHQTVFKYDSFPGLTEGSCVSDTLQTEAELLKNGENLRLHSNKSYNTFKCSNGQLSISDQSSGIEIGEPMSLPPPSPCYDTFSNGFHSPKASPDIMSSSANEYLLYARPTSPLYERFMSSSLSGNNSHVSSSSDGTNGTHDLMYSSSPPTSKLFTTSYYSKSDASGEYALQKVAAKPPVSFRAQSLQYRKSYSHPSQTIFETTAPPPPPIPAKIDRNIRSYYNSTTNYYDPSEINYMNTYALRKQATKSSEVLSSDDNTVKPFELLPSRFSCALDRPYATLAHPRDLQQKLQNRQFHSEQQRKYASNELPSQNDVEYLDPLDCKIGCQTTLRSKPQIPWYELAIKKDQRRQSCPPIQVNICVPNTFMNASRYVRI